MSRREVGRKRTGPKFIGLDRSKVHPNKERPQ